MLPSQTHPFANTYTTAIANKRIHVYSSEWLLQESPSALVSISAFPPFRLCSKRDLETPSYKSSLFIIISPGTICTRTAVWFHFLYCFFVHVFVEGMLLPVFQCKYYKNLIFLKQVLTAVKGSQKSIFLAPS